MTLSMQDRMTLVEYSTYLSERLCWLNFGKTTGNSYQLSFRGNFDGV